MNNERAKEDYMYTEDIIVDYKGFKPSQRTLSRVKSMTDNLYNESPSESCIKATFVRAGKKGYMGVVKVNSSVGSFFAKALGEDLNSLGENLFKQVRNQLKEWKTMRFLEPAAGSECYGQGH
jgi:hypothetical protein